MPRRYLLFFPPLVLLLLVLGIAGGLLRSGLSLAVPDAAVAFHGAIMIAFFTTVVSLERAVAYARLPALLVPASAAAAGILLLAQRPQEAQVLLLIAALGQPVLYIKFWKMSRELHIILQALAPLFLAAGTALWWYTGAIPMAINGWMLYLVWTIAGERLDLQRLARPSAAVQNSLVLLFAASFVALALQGFWPPWGTRGTAFVLLLLALWLLRYDIARRTVKLPGQTRYIAVALLTGYFWLLLGAALRLLYPDAVAGYQYDASLHAVWLGFVFSMVFGHLPVILPALSGARFLWHPLLYAPLGLLHLALALRVAGDLTYRHGLVKMGGLLGAVSIALFFVLALTRVRRRSPASTIQAH